MGLCRMGFGITNVAYSYGQLNRVNVDPRRSTVGFGNENNVQSAFFFAIVKVELSQFFFLFDVLAAIYLEVSRKRRRPDCELKRAVRSRVVDCLLPGGHFHVKISTRELRDRGPCCNGASTLF